MFDLPAVADLVIAVLLCHYIRRGKSGYEKCFMAERHHVVYLTLMYRTNYIIAQVLRYTITTGLATRLVTKATHPSCISTNTSFSIVSIGCLIAVRNLDAIRGRGRGG
jgi:hypothetical protein